MKNHLQKVIRKDNTENKKEFKIVLTQNERNLPLPQSLLTEFKESITDRDIAFYPDLSPLKQKIAHYSRVETDKIFITPGSDIGIRLLFELFDVKGKNVITSEFCFPMYQVYADINQAELKRVKYSGMNTNVDGIIEAIDEDTQFILLANPNSPIGDYIIKEDIVKLLETGITVVVDEAYIELTNYSSIIESIYTYPNLVVLRTFSKAFGAAGLRVGYIVTSETIMNSLSKLRFMYELSSLSAKYIEFILDNIKHYESYIRNTFEYKDELYENLKKTQNKILVHNTDSSWFWIRGRKDNKAIDKILSDEKISVRKMVLPIDNKEWVKFNYDLKLESTKIRKLLNYA